MSICVWLAALQNATVGQGGRYLMEKVKGSHVMTGAATHRDTLLIYDGKPFRQGKQ